VHIHTTCRDCGGSLLATDHDTVHPLCEPRPTRAEQLAAQWLQAVESGDTTRENELQTQINDLDSRPPRLHAAALTYASWGWPVFPLKPHAKTPATRNGFKDATTNPERIDAWWKQHPNSNIGLPTGHAFDVIDIDPPDGPASLAKLLTELAESKQTIDIHGQVTTASGGTHYYIKPNPKRGNKTRIRPGIDTRSIGGYVVAPPSTLGQSGRSWTWTYPPSPAGRSWTWTFAPSPAIKPGTGA
jgi:hypothetical protein